MKKTLIICMLIGFSFVSKGQAENPVEWEFDSKKITATSYEIHLTAKVEKGWHIYSQTTPEGGPIPTSITFNKNPLLTLSGKAKEIGKMEQRHEPLFGVDVKQFSGKVDFVQEIKLKANVKTNLSGKVVFMLCNDEMCLPPKSLPFSLSLK